MNLCVFRTMSIVVFIAQTITSGLIASEQDEFISLTGMESAVEKSQEPFVDFTGRITRNKVRMRLQPSLDAPILREFTRDDLLIVVGETEDFYAVKPPKDSKAYVFRTFVLDNKVEGNKVNVRLEPAIEAPVIAQLSNGDEIHGVVSPVNSKWLQIATPTSTRFYVCKEYVENIGSPAVMAQIEHRRVDVNELLNRSYQHSLKELDKSYETMNIEPAIAGYKKIIKEYTDFPEQSGRAKELLMTLQETLLQKKIAYLEAKAAANAAAPAQTSGTQPKAADLIETAKEPELNYASSPLSSEINKTPEWNKLLDPSEMTGKMASWVTAEKTLYDAWAAEQEHPTPQAYYEQQMEEVVILTGLLESYSRSVKNKPGDFLLVSTANSLPIAYLYSTNVNLQDKLGHITTIYALKRPNNNFAFPAYFVVSVE